MPHLVRLSKCKCMLRGAGARSPPPLPGLAYALTVGQYPPAGQQRMPLRLCPPRLRGCHLARYKNAC